MEETEIHLMTLPTDIDLLGHMNNGRYLSLMDLGRINLISRSGFFKRFAKFNLYAVVASEAIRFKKSLKLFQSFTLKTKIIGWDDKFIYIRHIFTANAEIYTISIVKLRILKKNPRTTLAPADVFKLGDIQKRSPVIPDWVTKWNESDQAMYSEIMNENKERNLDVNKF